MKTLTLYTIEELKHQFPKGYAAAMRNWRCHMQRFGKETHWTPDIHRSLKSLCRVCGVTRKEWLIEPYEARSFLQCKFPRAELEGVKGRRAIAWLENNLTGPLRISYGLTTIRRRAYGFRGGCILPRPFTGFRFDREFLEHLKTALREGRTLKDAFNGLAAVASKLLEQEWEKAISEESFISRCDEEKRLFTERGQHIDE